MSQRLEKTRTESLRALKAWLASCTRGGRISRNTVAIGIVVLHHMQLELPLSRADVISQGGEVKGARSGLGAILQAHGVPPSYLKEVTTRQGHQDGQRLFEAFNWGKKLQAISTSERDVLLTELIGVLVSQATDWLKRQNLKLQIDRGQAPSSWIRTIVENAKDRSSGVVEQHLVGAKLQRKYAELELPNYPAHAADVQTSREGDFSISASVYHVTATPSRGVIQKCASNLLAGKLPILLVPGSQVSKARVLAEEEGIDARLEIMSIEGFLAVNIIELADKEHKNHFAVLQEIVKIYNKRLAEVETDLSLQIEVR